MAIHATCTFVESFKIDELTVNDELLQMNNKWRAHYFDGLECELGS